MFRLLKRQDVSPFKLISSVQSTMYIEFWKVRFIFCERVKRRPHRQSTSSERIIVGAARREVLRIVGIIIIAGTQPENGRLTTLSLII